MDDNDVNIKVKLGADLSGGIQTREEMDKLRAKAKTTAAESAASSAKMSQGLMGVERTVGLVRKAFMGFGVIGIFTSIIAAVEKISESFGESKRQAEEFRKAAEAKDLAKSVDDLAESYTKVKAAIASAAEADKNALEIIDMEVKARRDLQDAKLDAAEQDELSKVDANALDAEEQKKAIQAKYAHMRSTNAAANRKEDLVLQRQKYNDAAATDDAEANAAEEQSAALQKKAKELRVRALEESAAATHLNDKDPAGFFARSAANLKDIVTLNWGHVGSETSEAGDAEREKHAAKSAEYIKQAEDLEKQAEAEKDKAEAKRESSAQNRRRGEALNGSIEAAEIAQDTTQVREDRAEDEARRGLAAKRAQIDKDKRYLANSDTLAADVQSKIDAEEQRKSAAEARVAKEREDAWRAQQALDSFNMNNKGRSGSSITAQRKELYAAVVRETEEATEAEADLKGVLATFSNTVKDLKTQLEQIKRNVAEAQKRTTVAAADGAAAE